MKSAIIVFLAALIALTIAPVLMSMASAQSVCTPQVKEFVAGITAQGQRLIGWGIGADGSLVQVYGKEGAEFSIVFMRPDSPMVCFGGVGLDWHTEPPPILGKPS